MTPEIARTLEEWRKNLSPEAFAVCRMGGTERPFSGKYDKHYLPGIYRCTCCGAALFESGSKYNSGSGWPSFFAPVSADSVRELLDDSHGMRRIEVRCAQCDAHLGHVFPDGPRPTGMRYCINSVALAFEARVESSEGQR